MRNDKMSNNVDIGPRKTMLILVVVIGCFAVLWPKVFYPMLVGSANQQMKPSSIDKTAGCCDVISDNDVNTIKILTELCNSIVQRPSVSDTVPLGKELILECRKQILSTCGIDIDIILHKEVHLGQTKIKDILNEVRSLNGSLCLKYNFGVAPWRLGIPHRITVNFAKIPDIRQERPAHMRPEMLHPALRERGRAIPASNTMPPPRIVEGRPGPIPGMRPPMGGAGHVVPASQKGTSTMSVVMPIYTIGIVIFFTYTLMKLMFKKPVDSTNGLYPSVQPDPNFRKQVFESERSPYMARHTKEELTTKLGWKERDTRDIELDQLRRRLRETELAMERIVAQMGSVPFKTERCEKNESTPNGTLANGTLANGTAVKPQDPDHDPTSVKVLGMEMTASCEGGQKWSRPNTPIISVDAPKPIEPLEPPQEIYLEGALPAQSQLLVADSATETETAELNNANDPAVVLSGKMTLSVISLDSLTGNENGNENELKDEIDDDDMEVKELMELDDDDDEKIESKYTTASNMTQAENDITGDDAQLTDGEQEDEIQED